MLMFTGGLGTLRPTEFWGALSSLDYRGFRRSDRSGVWIRYPKAAPKQPFHSPKHPKRVKITALLRALSFFFKKQSTFESKNVQKSLCPYGPFHIIQNNFKKNMQKSQCPYGPFHFPLTKKMFLIKNTWKNHRALADLFILSDKKIFLKMCKITVPLRIFQFFFKKTLFVSFQKRQQTTIPSQRINFYLATNLKKTP